ncbi:MAG: uracil-DNA glycosylase [Myxococcota bacterium]|nr:uracil-DNA glycosylase [Myxococcota bacterium]
MNEDDQEWLECLASARAWVQEWAAEGVDGFSRLPTATKLQENPSPRLESAAPSSQVKAPKTAPVERPEPHRSAAAPVTLEAIRQELGECQRCGLCAGRQNIVFGDGHPRASILFIGEGPGQQEDEQGLPFVGRAGALLTQMIEKGMGIPRSDVYICNIVKCRPPNNRNPSPQEASTCRPFLDQQIDAVQPDVIVTLGKPAASLLLDREVAITRLRGTWQEYRGIPMMPTLHPAYVLRQYTAENRRAVWEDLQAALTRSQGR